ncbi:MAG TPA: DUF664 domain-containing protein [Jatrophihabitans sp.]|jgi:hypothetical protein|uniref:mycothiol transferase n=1 Tax=Jatrophihabitans sp. TaxID=1932789 RepID=UPI002DF90B58|nr:DUF664 domain-containing protein [Jatrophihabitans sp.]
MTTTAELLIEGYARIGQLVHQVVDGADEAMLTQRLDPEANSIAWLVWHLTRVQDDHLAEAAGTEQVWTANGWAERFGLPFDDSVTGYGQDGDEVGQVRGVPAAHLSGYYDDVQTAGIAYLRQLGDDDLDRVVDKRWDPPVTLAVRLVSVLADDLQHAGQAAFLKGILERRG